MDGIHSPPCKAAVDEASQTKLGHYSKIPELAGKNNLLSHTLDGKYLLKL